MSNWGEQAYRYNDQIVKPFNPYEFDFNKISNKKFTRVAKIQQTYISGPQFMKTVFVNLKLELTNGGTQTINFGLNYKGELDWNIPYSFKSFFENFPDCKEVSLQSTIEKCLQLIEELPYKEEDFPAYYKRQMGLGI